MEGLAVGNRSSDSAANQSRGVLNCPKEFTGEGWDSREKKRASHSKFVSQPPLGFVSIAHSLTKLP